MIPLDTAKPSSSLLRFAFTVAVVPPLDSLLCESPPNIVLILADDLGWRCGGLPKRMKTPNLDRLVSWGVELRNFYVAPMCSPTRERAFLPVATLSDLDQLVPSYRLSEIMGYPSSETTLAELLEPLRVPASRHIRKMALRCIAEQNGIP